MTRHRCPLSSLLFCIVLKIVAEARRQGKEIEGIQIGKEEVTLPLFADDVTLYMRDLKCSTRKLEMVNNFSKVAV